MTNEELKAENARLKAEVDGLVDYLRIASEVGIKIADDNLRLKAEVERLRASSFVTAVPVEEYEKLKAEVEDLTVGLNDQGYALLRYSAENERLRMAGDALLVALLRLTSGTPNWDGKVYWNWNAAKDGKPFA